MYVEYVEFCISYY